MRKVAFLFFLYIINLYADSIDLLLKEYEDTNKNSLNTIDEKLGTVTVYSQKEIKLMQYNKLSDILKELPLANLHKNNFGLHTLTLPGTKSDVSGYFRFFLNDHELSSVHTQSAFLTWGDLPLDFIDYIEIYYGEGSFSLGNETGYVFIKAYTKDPQKENATEIISSVSNKNYNSQGVLNSSVLENGWAYLIYAGNQNSDESRDKSNHSNRKYAFIDFENKKQTINFGYTQIDKDNYKGISTDSKSDEGEITSKDFFLSYTRHFLDDESLKASISMDINERKYEEKNKEGIFIVPVIDLTNVRTTIPKEYSEDLKLKKINAFLLKETDVGNNNIVTALNYKKKTYDVKSRESTNFLNQVNKLDDFYDFNEENIYSFLLQDNYSVNEDLILLFNTKYDIYDRNGQASNEKNFSYRLGSIYTPSSNLGFKVFYTDTYIPFTFYNYDFKSPFSDELKSTDISFYSIESTYITTNSKTRLYFSNTEIKNFIYLSEVGFLNVDDKVTQKNYMLDYSYDITNTNKIMFNYFYSDLTENINNSNKGGFIKYMGKYKKFEYYTSLIYRNSYRYLDAYADDSFDFSLGTTYKLCKNISISLKGENLFDDSTKSIYTKNSKNFTLDDRQRSVTLTLNWLF